MIDIIIFVVTLATTIALIYTFIELIYCHDYNDYRSTKKLERRKRRFYRNSLLPKRRHSEPPRYRKRKRQHILIR